MERKTLKRSDVVGKLLSNDKGKTILLFGDSQKMRSVSNQIGADLRDSLDFRANMCHAFKVTNRKIVVKDTVVLLGLKSDEALLLNNFAEEEIAYYEEG